MTSALASLVFSQGIALLSIDTGFSTAVERLDREINAALGLQRI